MITLSDEEIRVLLRGIYNKGFESGYSKRMRPNDELMDNEFNACITDLYNENGLVAPLLPSAVTGGMKWNMVTADLPKDGERVLLFHDGRVVLGVRCGENNYDIGLLAAYAIGATHWMPLPPNPGQPAQGKE